MRSVFDFSHSYKVNMDYTKRVLEIVSYNMTFAMNCYSSKNYTFPCNRCKKIYLSNGQRHLHQKDCSGINNQG